MTPAARQLARPSSPLLCCCLMPSRSANYVYFLAYQELIKLRPTPTSGSAASGKDTELDRLVTGEYPSLLALDPERGG